MSFFDPTGNSNQEADLVEIDHIPDQQQPPSFNSNEKLDEFLKEHQVLVEYEDDNANSADDEEKEDMECSIGNHAHPNVATLACRPGNEAVDCVFLQWPRTR